MTSFDEKPDGDGGWINGGFFVLSPAVGDLIEGDETIWEREPMEALAREGPTARLRAPRVLAADGHPARQAIPGRALGSRTAARGRSGDRMPRSGAAAASS